MVALEESISKAFAMKTMAPTLLRQNFRTRRKHWVCHAESNAGRHVGGCRRLPNVANGHVYGVLNWPTFHSMGLLHGGFFSAWLTLSFPALGYVRPFPAVEDTSP